MNTNNIYYVCLVEIVGKKFVLGRTIFDDGYLCKVRPLGNRYVYKVGDTYIDLKSKNKYKLYSKMLSSELEVGKIVIDDNHHNVLNFKNTLDKYNLQHEDSQIEIKKHMTKRKILRMISGGKNEKSI